MENIQTDDRALGVKTPKIFFLHLNVEFLSCLPLQKYEIPQYFTCLEFSPSGDVITGDSNGSITVWGKGNFL